MIRGGGRAGSKQLKTRFHQVYFFSLHVNPKTVLFLLVCRGVWHCEKRCWWSGTNCKREGILFCITWIYLIKNWPQFVVLLFKSVEVFDYVKKDFDEFTQTVQEEVSSTASALKEKLKVFLLIILCYFHIQYLHFNFLLIIDWWREWSCCNCQEECHFFLEYCLRCFLHSSRGWRWAHLPRSLDCHNLQLGQWSINFLSRPWP